VHFFLWFVVSFAFGFGFRLRPVVLVQAALVVAVGVPEVAAPVLTGVEFGAGGVRGLLPITVFVLAAALGAVFGNPMGLAAIKLPPSTASIVPVVVIVAAVTTALGANPGGLGQVVDEIVGPFVLLLLVLWAARQDAAAFRRVRTTVLLLGVGEAALGLAQYATHRPWLFEGYLEKTDWYAFMTHDGFRSMGTFNHPLVFALFLLVAVAAALSVVNAWHRYLFVLLFGAAIISSGSRSSLAAAAALLALSLMVGAARTRGRAMMVLVLASLGVVLMGPLGSGLAARFSDDRGSSDARRAAANLFLHQIQGRMFAGQGVGASYLDADFGGLKTSFESPLFILPLEIGLIWALLLFATMLVLILSGLRGGRPTVFAMGALTVFADSLTFSSWGVKGSVGYLVWFAIGLALCAAGLDRPDRLPEPVPRAVVRAPARRVEKAPV
jgi:hypothetical protein